MATISFDLVSPENLVFNDEVGTIIVPGKDGDLGILPGHSKVMSSLRPGRVMVYSEDKNLIKSFFVSGGFAKPPETKKDLIKFLSSLYTITLPGLREDITLLCPGKIPKSPSLPGTIIVPTSSLKTRFSGETKSKEIVAIMRLQLLIF